MLNKPHDQDAKQKWERLYRKRVVVTCRAVVLSFIVLSGTTRCEISAAKFGQCAVCCVIAGGTLYLMSGKPESTKSKPSAHADLSAMSKQDESNTNSTAQSGTDRSRTTSAARVVSASATKVPRWISLGPRSSSPPSIGKCSDLRQALIDSSWCGTEGTRTCSNKWYRYVNLPAPLHTDADRLISFVQDHRDSHPTRPLHHRVYFCARDTNCTEYPDWNNLAGLVQGADAEKRMLCAMLAIKALSQRCMCDVYGDLHQEGEGMVQGSGGNYKHRVVGDFNPMKRAIDLPRDNQEIYENCRNKDCAELAARGTCKEIGANKPEALCIIYRYAKDRFEVCAATNATRFFPKK